MKPKQPVARYLPRSLAFAMFSNRFEWVHVWKEANESTGPQCRQDDYIALLQSHTFRGIQVSLNTMFCLISPLRVMKSRKNVRGVHLTSVFSRPEIGVKSFGKQLFNAFGIPISYHIHKMALGYLKRMKHNTKSILYVCECQEWIRLIGLIWSNPLYWKREYFHRGII